MAKTFDVICLGAALVDLPLRPVERNVFDTDSYPVDEIGMQIGGDAVNEATVLTRLGHSVSLVGMTGKDVAGAFVRQHVKDNGIDATWLKERDDIATSINVGLVTPDGERTFITSRNGSCRRMSEEDISPDALKHGRLLSFASFFNSPLLTGEVAARIFRKAKEHGMVICADVINPRMGETLEDIRQALSYADYLFPNYDEAKGLTGETDPDRIADVFLDAGVKHVCVKKGREGAFIKSADEAVLVPGYPDSNCIDTTGAGDNFAAGFISAILDGKSFREAAQFANAVASVAVEAVGATAGVQSREQAQARYRAYLTKTGQ